MPVFFLQMSHRLQWLSLVIRLLVDGNWGSQGFTPTAEGHVLKSHMHIERVLLLKGASRFLFGLIQLQNKLIFVWFDTDTCSLGCGYTMVLHAALCL